MQAAAKMLFLFIECGGFFGLAFVSLALASATRERWSRVAWCAASWLLVMIQSLCWLFILGLTGLAAHGGSAREEHEKLESMLTTAIYLGAFITIGWSFWVLWKPSAKDQNEKHPVARAYEGPRCVACREPIEPAISFCPHCGWTQPA